MNLHHAGKTIFTKKKSNARVSIEQFADNFDAMRLVKVVKEKAAPFVFVTGGAGTGKTTLLKLIIEETKNAVLTATTGIASMNIGGQTLHSLFRLGAKLMLKSDLEKHKCPNQALFDAMEYLIIDEVSMLRADMLDAVDYLLKRWRKNSAPFGGVMVIGSGDLLQLPPVIGKAEAEIYFRMYASPWFFYANCLARIDAEFIELKSIYRQRDEDFLNALNRIRENNDHRDSVALINRSCYRDIDPNFVPELVLCARNDRADEINNERLNQINSPLKVYRGEVSGSINPKSKLPSPLELRLKVGCRVMITKNIELAVNGQLGTIKSLGNESVSVELDDGKIIEVERAEWEQTRYGINPETQEIMAQEGADSYKQLPLTLGYAVSIHKSQGLTLDSVLIDLGEGAFASGMAYTALSRCRSLQGIKLAKPLSMKDVITDKTILSFYENVRKHAA